MQRTLLHSRAHPSHAFLTQGSRPPAPPDALTASSIPLPVPQDFLPHIFKNPFLRHLTFAFYYISVSNMGFIWGLSMFQHRMSFKLINLFFKCPLLRLCADLLTTFGFQQSKGHNISHRKTLEGISTLMVLSAVRTGHGVTRQPHAQSKSRVRQRDCFFFFLMESQT